MNKMTSAINSLSKLILTLQGNGDYQGVDDLVTSKGIINDTLAIDLDRYKPLKLLTLS